MLNKEKTNNKIIRSRDIPFYVFQSDNFHDYASKVNNIYDSKLLENIYFHDNNIKIIQSDLIKQVLKETNGNILIDKQNKEDIMIFMKYIFVNYADTSIITEKKKKIRNHIKYLNNLVVEDILPNLLSEVLGKCGYNARTFGEREFLNNPITTSKRNEKILPSWI